MTSSSPPENQRDYSDLSAVLVNTSLKRDGSKSHTRLLMGVSADIMEDQGVDVDRVHMLDHEIPPGIHPDMTEHGWETDDWPALWETIEQANILVIGSPIWLGEESSVCRVLIERLYAMSAELNDHGQSSFYNKVAGCVITGNEDGVKHTAMSIVYALQHLGYTIPPQADCGWIGEAGPGPSYGDEREDGGRVGFDNEFTKRNTTIMTWNLLHMAHILDEVGGIPNHGNDRTAWDAGCRFDYENPEHRV